MADERPISSLVAEVKNKEVDFNNTQRICACPYAFHAAAGYYSPVLIGQNFYYSAFLFVYFSKPKSLHLFTLYAAMTWCQAAVNTYLKNVSADRISYHHFLHHSIAMIRQHLTSDTEWQLIDRQLFSCFKASLPEGAPSNALRRSRVERFWLDIMPDPVASASTAYENTALRLLDQARQKKEKEISARLQGSATLQASSSTTPYKRRHEPSTATDEYELQDSFDDLTVEDRVRSLISKYRNEANHVPTLHKQDLLFYGIIDLVPSSSTSVCDIISEADLKEVIRHTVHQSPHGRNGPNYIHVSQVKDYSSAIMESVNDHTMLRQALKTARQHLRSTQDRAKWKRDTIKLMKHIRDQYSSEGVCALVQPQGEMHYIATYLAPLFKILLNKCDDISLQWGDQSLPATKEEEQRAQRDHDRRSKGNSPDAILSISQYDITFSLIEVTGPPNANDHSHFVGDKVKLAKNMKTMLKKIRRHSRGGDEDIYASIKLYGIQTYLNHMYIYSLCEPTRGIYVFDLVFSFDVKCPSGMLPMFIPKFFKHIWKLKNLMLRSTQTIMDFVNSDTLSDTSDASSDSRDTMYISPKKRRTSRAQDIQ
ncbi:predicted protein [Lichtheimia corymbifera JMRC:FSU:9682]|uniref:Uncharacterized protein n=1 Tax=Lichtheimia corymbifera JMRC:FSU:9682 TaxID=1263082 RepID=A0A068RXM6_9FUNG|nr:predicted protein [Lichtheimia corymbifera JMRC:FSU:9682]